MAMATSLSLARAIRTGLKLPRSAVMINNITSRSVRIRCLGQLRSKRLLTCNQFTVFGRAWSPLISSSQQQFKSFSSDTEYESVDQKLRQMSEEFAEARMEIEDCHDSIGTVYYDEDFGDCSEIVDGVLSLYQEILEQSESEGDEKQTRRIAESWRMKLEQLKGELAQLQSEANDDH
eukprot:m.24759 g.24759  ORF g.24759 m.24759 type:complete len:177 (-) comp14741_c0_seq1:189-719(-)